MTGQEVFVLADRTLNDVVAKIADDQWDMRMPASFARRGWAGRAKLLRMSRTWTSRFIRLSVLSLPAIT